MHICSVFRRLRYYLNHVCPGLWFFHLACQILSGISQKVALRFVYIFWSPKGDKKTKINNLKFRFTKRPKIFKAIKEQLVPDQAGPLTTNRNATFLGIHERIWQARWKNQRKKGAWIVSHTFKNILLTCVNEHFYVISNWHYQNIVQFYPFKFKNTKWTLSLHKNM